MRLFWEISKRAFQRHLTYRTAAIVGLVTNVLYGILRASVLLALLGDNEQLAGYGRDDLLTYVALTQAIIAYLSLFGWTDLMESVYTGEVSTILLKPIGFFPFWLAQDFGRALANFLLRGLTILLLYELIFGLSHPQTILQWTAVLITLLLSWLVSFGFRFLINLTAFWSPDARGIIKLGFIVTWFFSGFLMPLALFPPWLQQLAAWTPFPYLFNATVDIYTGQLVGLALWQTIAIQALWAAILALLSQLVWQTAVKRLTIAGG